MKQPKTILITGASSGLGKALALAYAQANIKLYLTGRNLENLQQTQSLCQAQSAEVVIKLLDVKDVSSTQAWIEEIGSDIDLAIANAGISAGTASGLESATQIDEIFQTNINGVLNIINPLVKLMKNKGQGQIAIMSSLAGFKGLPSSPAYSASKAAVRVYGEALRGSLASLGIEVNVICPGYIKTPMTDANDFYMPFLMTPTQAAAIIKKGLAKNQSRIAFPMPFYFLVWLATALSCKITDPIFALLPKKKSLSVN